MPSLPSRPSDPGRPTAPIFDVRAGEGRDVVLALTTLLTFMIGHGTLETARDALFLSRLPAQKLPWVYVAMAASGSVVAWLAARPRVPAAGARRLTLVIAAAALGTALLSWPARSAGTTIAYALYVWIGLCATFVTVELWQLLADRFTAEQAKRLYGIIGAGAVVGVALGSALASVLSSWVRPGGLVIVGAVAFAVASLLPSLLRPSPGRAAEPDEAPLPSPLRVLAEERHARRMLALVFLATVTVTVGDFVFKTMVAASVEPARLGVFFGRFYFVVNVIGLFVQVAATAWILRMVGAVRGLAILPAALAVGSVVFVLSPALSVVVLMKAVDGALRHSVQRTSLEVLFLPLPHRARRSLKGILEAVGQRGGQAFASAAILVGVSVGAGPRWLALSVGALGCLWLVALVGARGDYVDLFRRRLRAGGPGTGLPLPSLDLAALETLVAALGSADAREVIAAIDVLEAEGRAHLVPSLLAHHPSVEVARRVTDLLARHRRPEAVALLQESLRAPAHGSRGLAVRARPSGASPGEALERSEDDSTALRAAALVDLASEGTPPPHVRRRIDELARHGDPEAQAALAAAIAASPRRRWIPTLVALAGGAREEVLVHVAEAARRMPSADLVPVLVDMLRRRDVRDAAREALAAAGALARDPLLRALSSPATPLVLRRHVPRTLISLANDSVVRALIDAASSDPDGMTRFKALRALGAIARRSPALSFDRDDLALLARRTLHRATQLLDHRVAVVTSPGGAASEGGHLLGSLLRQKERHALNRLFRILSLLDPAQDFELVHDGLRSPDPKVRAASREIVADVVDPDLRGDLLVMIDEVDDAEKVRRLFGPRASRGVDARLEELSSDRSESVRLLARLHRGERSARGGEVALAGE